MRRRQIIIALIILLAAQALARAQGSAAGVGMDSHTPPRRLRRATADDVRPLAYVAAPRYLLVSWPMPITAPFSHHGPNALRDRDDCAPRDAPASARWRRVIAFTAAPLSSPQEHPMMTTLAPMPLRLTRRTTLAGIAFAATACAISQQQEVQMGAQYATQIDTQLPIIRDAAVNSYITSLGSSLAAVTDTRSLAWHFAVVDSKEVNAFAVPGGWVYVNRGLIDRAARMDELAGVIGHEIGHVTLRHTVQQMQQSDKVNGGLMAVCTLTKVCDSGASQAVIGLGGSALFASFSRQDEAQADDEGVKTTVKAGIDPRGLPDMFRVLLAERQTNPSAVDAFFATHPLEEARITATEKQIAAYPAPALKNLRADTDAFQQMKRRLASLAPSPAPKAVAKHP